MNYTDLSKELLDVLYALGRKKPTKEIGSNMKGELFTLLYLSMAETPVSPGELGMVMEISTARVAAVLNTLEKKGLILRMIDPADRRKIVVNLTEKGKIKADSARQCSLAMTSQMLEWIGEEDARHLIRIIGKVTEHLSELQTVQMCKEVEDVIED